MKVNLPEVRVQVRRTKILAVKSLIIPVSITEISWHLENVSLSVLSY